MTIVSLHILSAKCYKWKPLSCDRLTGFEGTRMFCGRQGNTKAKSLPTSCSADSGNGSMDRFQHWHFVSWPRIKKFVKFSITRHWAETMQVDGYCLNGAGAVWEEQEMTVSSFFNYKKHWWALMASTDRITVTRPGTIKKMKWHPANMLVGMLGYCMFSV